MIKSTFEIPCGNGVTTVIKKRFPSTALARLSERAPTITDAVTDHIVDKDRRAELSEALKPIDDPAEAQGKIEEMQREQQRDFVEHGLELVRAPYEELDALHAFCVEVTASVKGATKLDGEPLSWGDADDEDRKLFYDCDVPTMTKLTIYVYCWMLKNGVDPDAIAEAGSG